MKSKVVTAIFLLVFLCGTLHAQTKRVTGTWVNLFWQDERNNYMNPHYIDTADPEFWHLKIKELHEMGMEYVVIMAVANEQKAAYPSAFMEHSYPEGRKSPVEAIMDAADECGMHVFMSCGWAKSQLDDLRDPEIVRLQIEIMKETAALFSGHESFYGWYLPVEDSLEPVLSDHAVEAVNSMAGKARSLTPGKKVMISPYGICNADFGNPEFAAQIRRLEVDIIAYQDEVGCVREPMPMKRMKEHFSLLGEIHEGSGIEFWANIESFTWDRETNSWYSALVPAAFGRYLSQLVGVSRAGVGNVLSFSVFGIYDKPGSPIPLGQPLWANRAYADYMDWLAGRGRWPLLEATFYGDVRNGAEGAGVVSSSGDAAVLVDGSLGYEDYNAPEWHMSPDGEMAVVIDLGEIWPVDVLAARFLAYAPASVSIPDMVDFYVSDTGECYEKVSTVVMENTDNDLHDCWIDIAMADGLGASGRFVKVVAECHGSAICCDEIFVNPVY